MVGWTRYPMSDEHRTNIPAIAGHMTRANPVESTRRVLHVANVGIRQHHWWIVEPLPRCCARSPFSITAFLFGFYFRLVVVLLFWFRGLPLQRRGHFYRLDDSGIMDHVSMQMLPTSSLFFMLYFTRAG